MEVQEAENQIITEYPIFAERPSDRELLVRETEDPGQRNYGDFKTRILPLIA